MADNNLIIFDNLVSGYGKKVIINGLSISIRRGAITTLIGRNGVGKTTLLNTLMGLITPISGNIFYDNQEIVSKTPNLLVEMGIAYVPQSKSVFPHMTVLEHLEIGACILRNSKKMASTLEFVFSLFPKLKERSEQRAGTLSGGERQMLSIGRALMSKPKLLLMDEPSFGLAPIMVDTVFDSIGNISRENVTIFLVEQNAKKALANSDFCFVMDMGRIVRNGYSREMLYDEEIKKAYLGGGKA